MAFPFSAAGFAKRVTSRFSSFLHIRIALPEICVMRKKAGCTFFLLFRAVYTRASSYLHIPFSIDAVVGVASIASARVASMNAVDNKGRKAFFYFPLPKTAFDERAEKKKKKKRKKKGSIQLARRSSTRRKTRAFDELVRLTRIIKNTSSCRDRRERGNVNRQRPAKA